MVDFTGKFFLGFCIVFSFLCIVAKPSGALGILVLSIICTAGLGLLFWIPLCIAVGFVFYPLLHMFTSKLSSHEEREINHSTPKIKSSDQNESDLHSIFFGTPPVIAESEKSHSTPKIKSSVKNASDLHSVFFGTPPVVSEQKVFVSADESAVYTYIKQAKEYGVSRENIIKRLRESGWDEEFIARVYSRFF